MDKPTVRQFIIENPRPEGTSQRQHAQNLVKKYNALPGKQTTSRYIRKKIQEVESGPTASSPEAIKERTTWDESGDSAQYQYEGHRNFATLEEALDFCDADMDVWDVDRWIFNAWDVTMRDASKNPVKRTNYQVKIWFKKRVDEMTVEDWTDELQERARPFVVKRTNGSGVGVFKMADFHMGADISQILKTPDFNHNTIIHYFDLIAQYINSRKYEKVYVSLLGDFIESFTGLNHRDTWKGIRKDGYGIKVVRFAHGILRDHLYCKIKNLEWVGFVSGNHDRTTDKTDGDQQGGAAEALHWAFQMECNTDSEWHPILLSKEIDGICYIDTHGHLGISKQEIAQIVFKYGKQGMYNIFCKGHKHTREQKRRWTKTLMQINNQDVVSYDEADFRAITVPPLFTGNFYSQSNDWNGLAGFVEFYNNGRGYPIFVDYTL